MRRIWKKRTWPRLFKKKRWTNFSRKIIKNWLILIYLFPYRSTHIFNVSAVLYISYSHSTLQKKWAQTHSWLSNSLDMSLCLYPTTHLLHLFPSSIVLPLSSFSLAPTATLSRRQFRDTGGDRETPISFCCRFNLLCTLIFQGPSAGFGTGASGSFRWVLMKLYVCVSHSSCRKGRINILTGLIGDLSAGSTKSPWHGCTAAHHHHLLAPTFALGVATHVLYFHLSTISNLLFVPVSFPQITVTVPSRSLRKIKKHGSE